MSTDINIGDIVLCELAGATNESKVRQISTDGLYVFIDCYVGRNMVFYYEKAVRKNHVKLIMKIN
jgi:hypothetical protein